jgi:hypothetical protein
LGIRPAGQLSIDAAIPAKIWKLKAGWDWWDEAIAAALVAVDSEPALEKTIGAYKEGDWHVRNYLGGVLAKLRIPGFEAELIQLAGGGIDHYVRTNLGVALAACGSEESMHHAHLVDADNPAEPERFHTVEIL